MKWEFCLDRTPKGNVVQVRCGPLVVRIPQRVWREATDELFPLHEATHTSQQADADRWDVGEWNDLTSEQKDQESDRRYDEWR